MTNGTAGSPRGGSEAREGWCARIDEAPATVALPVLGLLGGACGEPVSTWLRDYPPDVVGAIQGFVLRHVPGGMVCEVIGRSDLQRLAREPERFALVLVDPIHGRRSAELAAQWLLNRRRGSRCPGALFGPDDGLQQAPGAMLALRAHPVELRKARGWFLGDPPPDGRVRAYLERGGSAPAGVDFVRLGALIGPSAGPPLWRPGTLRSRETLRGLLAGRALLRRVLADGVGRGPIRPTIDDYESIYRFLQDVMAGAPEEAGDPLLVAMIGRANLYLKLKAADAGGRGPEKAGRRGNSSRAAAPRSPERDGPRARPITLREVADLGNPGSAITKSLLGRVLASGDREALDELGLARQWPDRTPLRGADVGDLAVRLRTWTAKQARSRFDRMRRDGLLDAARRPANGPWVYHIPEECGPLPGDFQTLPPVELVRRALAAGDDPPARP